MLNTSIIHNNGDTVNWKVVLTKSGATCPYSVNVTAPPGTTITAFNTLKVGATYAYPIVNIGNMVHGEVVELNFTVQITNVLLAVANQFTLTAVVSGCDTNPLNNTITDIITYEFCPPMAGAVNDIPGCMCGSVATNDTKCSSCTTEWRVVAGSEVNGTVTMDVTTGNYHWTYGSDTSIAGSFQYHIWCVNCSNGGSYDVSGPATVTIPALTTTSIIPANLIKEDFIVSPGGTSVTLSSLPIPGKTVFAFIDGIEQPLTEYVVVATLVTFANPFSLPMNGVGTIRVSIWYHV